MVFSPTEWLFGIVFAILLLWLMCCCYLTVAANPRRPQRKLQQARRSMPNMALAKWMRVVGEPEA